MQPRNTARLAEAIGLCFAESDWAKLSHLFGNLTLHYTYAFSREDVMFNLDIMVAQPEYGHHAGLTEMLRELANTHHKHDAVVDFMKSFESLMLMCAEFKASHLNSADPMIDNLTEMATISESIDGHQTSPLRFLDVFFMGADSGPAVLERLG